MENILIVVPDDRLGGAEQYLKNLAYYHLDFKAKIHVVFLKKQISGHWEDLKDLGDVKLFFSNSDSELSGIRTSFLNILKLRKIRFDFVYTSHLHTTSFIGVLIKLGILKKKYFIGRESTSIFHRFSGKQLFIFKKLYWLGYSSVDLLINQTEFMKNQLIKGLPWIEKKTKVKVIPNPINLVAIKNLPLLTSKVHDRKFIVSAGRLIPEKGYDVLIESFLEISKQFKELDLLILGEGFERPELERQINRTGLKNRVFLKGHVDNVLNYFKEAEVCVVSSRIEGFPNVLLQMMSQNNKVVSTKCAGGIEDISGIICAETEDKRTLEAGLKLALGTDLDKNKKLFAKELEERSLNNFQNRVKEFLVA